MRLNQMARTMALSLRLLTHRAPWRMYSIIGKHTQRRFRCLMLSWRCIYHPEHHRGFWSGWTLRIVTCLGDDKFVENMKSSGVTDEKTVNQSDAPVCDTGKGKSKLSDRKVTYGFHLVEGQMGHSMEDYHVAQFKEFDDNEVGLFAIFDGHSGNDVASYLRNHLFDNILNEPDFWTDTMSAIRRAYHRIDGKILKRKENAVRRRGGSTAVTMIVINGEKLVVANVGDSRAVICEDDDARQLSVDHEPLKEKDAIESRGGFVTNNIGNVPRVDGQLAMSRAFGDSTLKEHISSDPDVVIEGVDEDAEFIILASDGIWKVMSNQEAADTIKDIKDAQKAAVALIDEALERGSKDDISCIVVRLL